MIVVLTISIIGPAIIALLPFLIFGGLYFYFLSTSLAPIIPFMSTGIIFCLSAAVFLVLTEPIAKKDNIIWSALHTIILIGLFPAAIYTNFLIGLNAQLILVGVTTLILFGPAVVYLYAPQLVR